jgi:hypothetical protein
MPPKEFWKRLSSRLPDLFLNTLPLDGGGLVYPLKPKTIFSVFFPYIEGVCRSMGLMDLFIRRGIFQWSIVQSES